MKPCFISFIYILISLNIIAQDKITIKYDTVSTTKSKYIIRIRKVAFNDKSFYIGYHIYNLSAKLNTNYKITEYVPKDRVEFFTENPVIYYPKYKESADSLIKDIFSDEQLIEFRKHGIESIDFNFVHDLSGKILEVKYYSFTSKKQLEKWDMTLFDNIEQTIKECLPLEPKSLLNIHKEKDKVYLRKMKYFRGELGFDFRENKKNTYGPWPPALPLYDKPNAKNK